MNKLVAVGTKRPGSKELRITYDTDAFRDKPQVMTLRAARDHYQRIATTGSGLAKEAVRVCEHYIRGCGAGADADIETIISLAKIGVSFH